MKPSNSKSAGAYVALFRGINVGGRNMLPMKDLVAFFLDAGCSDAQSYIQSGNVIFRAPPSLVARVPTRVVSAITKRFGIEARIVVRSASELPRVVEDNPYLHTRTDVASFHVAFLAEAPSAERVAALDPDRSPPDQFAVRGREIYLALPHGTARSKLTNQYFDSKLGTTSTLRNWRTVLKLRELTGG